LNEPRHGDDGFAGLGSDLPDPTTGFGERVRRRLRDEQVIWFNDGGG